MRKLIDQRSAIAQVRTTAEGGEVDPEALNMTIDMVVAAVRKDHQDRLREHIEESVGPALLGDIASAVMTNMSDVDPTQPESSLPGPPPVSNGSASTGTALPAPSTPSI